MATDPTHKLHLPREVFDMLIDLPEDFDVTEVTLTPDEVVFTAAGGGLSSDANLVYVQPMPGVLTLESIEPRE